VTDKEKLPRSKVRIMQRCLAPSDKSELPKPLSELAHLKESWVDIYGEELFSTHEAELALRKLAKSGCTYRIVTVHREVTASIEQREPKIRLA